MTTVLTTAANRVDEFERHLATHKYINLHVRMLAMHLHCRAAEERCAPITREFARRVLQEQRASYLVAIDQHRAAFDQALLEAGYLLEESNELDVEVDEGETIAETPLRASWRS